MCPTLADVGRHLMGESQRCKGHGDKTWTLICDRLCDWLKDELEEARKNGKEGAQVLVATGDVCVARTRILKRSHTLDASACLEDGADGAGADSKRKRARAAAALQEPEGGAAAEEPRLLALADGVACPGRQEEEEDKAEEVEQSTTAIEPPAVALETPGAVAAQLAPEPPEGQVQEDEPGTGDASGLGA